jgi:hypothetical protein
MKPGNQRIKGSSFERQIASELYDELGIKFQRVLNQVREPGLPDLEPIDCAEFPFVIEVKRYATGTYSKPQWWHQVCAAANKARMNGRYVYPCLIWKYDRLPVRCRIPVDAISSLNFCSVITGKSESYDWKYAVDLDWQTFIMLTREVLSNDAL